MTYLNEPSQQYSRGETASSLQFAGFWIRGCAALIDGVIFGIIDFAVDAALSLGNPSSAIADKMDSTRFAEVLSGFGTQTLVNTILNIAMIAALTSSSWQATVGKRAMGIYIVRSKGARLNLLTAGLREVCKLVSGLILCIGYMMVGWTKEKTGLHDLMVDTRVVYGRTVAR